MSKLLESGLNLTTKLSTLLSVVFAFLAAVTWLAARDAVLFIAPIMVYTLAFFSLVTAGAAFLTCTEWFRLKRAQLIRDRTLATNEAHMSNNEARLSDLEHDRQRMHYAAEGRLLAATVRQVERGLIHPAHLADAKFSSFPAAIAKHIDNDAVPLLETPRPELLPALADCPNVLVVGGKGRGKTSLLQWLEHERLQTGNIVTVLDSHATPSQWAGRVIGAGRNYESIAAAMLDLNTMLDNRYEQRTKGKSDFLVINTFIDEFTLLPGYLKELDFDIQKYSFSQLTEGRKVGLNCVWGSHSDRAKALGLEGATDLKECFDAIVYLKKVKSDYYALIDFGEGVGETKYNHPGPFTVNRPASKVKILSLPPVTHTVTDDTPIAVDNWPQPEPPKAKHHPDNVNAAIDEFLTADPDTFPSKGEVTQAVGITGGSKYKAVIETYERRFNEWQNA